MARRKAQGPDTVTVADVPDEFLPGYQPSPRLWWLGADGPEGDFAAFVADNRARRDRWAAWKAKHGARFTYPELAAEHRRRHAPDPEDDTEHDDTQDDQEDENDE